MVPANSTRDSPTPSYSGYPPYSFFYPYAPLTLSARTSQTFQVLARVMMQVLLPRTCRNTRGLCCSVFARHYLRNHCCFLLLCLLRCFSSAGLPPPGKPGEYLVFNQVGCPIRISADQFVCADPRGFSQLITSFFASESQGIHPAPFLTFLVARSP